jgi:GAF domain-containing protein
MNERTGFSWQRLGRQAEGLLGVSTNRISNAANLSALLFQELSDVSWVGFYFLDGQHLMVGPFQGKPACVRIELGNGVCGTAAVSGKTIRVADVDAFDGHIACDAEARSELVVPLYKQGQLLGVLDVDSTSYDRFSELDEAGLEDLARIYLASIS